MADLSQITLPNNITYNLKDSIARGIVGLPSINASVDNGKTLQVQNGSWAKADMPESGYDMIVTLTMTGYPISSITADKTFQDVNDAISYGKSVGFVVIWNGNALNPGYVNITDIDTNYITLMIMLGYPGMGDSSILFGSSIIQWTFENNTESFEFEQLDDSQTVPTVTSSDNGKVLKVVNGVWTAATDAGLPSVTSSDNGKILQVINGAWAITTLPVYNGEVI